MQIPIPIESDGPAPSRRGRPRDPELEDRVFDAAITLYGQAGWEGFSFEGIAKMAGVGKNALYRRWPTREALLGEVLVSRWVSVERIDSGSLREDLKVLCLMLFEHLAGPLGNVGLQLHLDVVRHEVVAAAVADYREELKRSARDLVRRAVKRGDLPDSATPTLILDVIAGSVMSHVMATPEALRTTMRETAPDYAERLVDLVLRGVATPNEVQGEDQPKDKASRSTAAR